MPTSALSTTPSRRTLGDVVGGRHNAYGIIRFVLASLVIVDHAFPLGGFGRDPFWRLTGDQESLGGLAVAGFFIVSGFLIARSAMSNDLIGFLWRRILRIMPAFWLCLAVSALAIGPWIYHMQHDTLLGYFTRGAGGPVAYLVNNAALEVGQYGILDVFLPTPYGQQVQASVFNGSLWTLIYEFRCYLILGLLAAFGVLARAGSLVPVMAAVFVDLGAVHPAAEPILTTMAPWLGDIQFVRLTGLFLLGSAAAVYPERVPLDGRLALGALFVAAGSLFYSGGFHFVGVPAMAYVTLWFAYCAPRSLFAFGARNDYSYGIYIYGFLVQQVLAALGWQRLGVLAYIVAAWLLTLGCAVVSWHLLEKPALQLKDWGPGKGLGHLLERRGGAGPGADRGLDRVNPI